jgi:hypothetical protein
VATANLSGTVIPRGSLPATIPTVTPVRSTLCVTYGSGKGLQRHIVSGATVPSGATPTGATTATALALAQVWLPPAHGSAVLPAGILDLIPAGPPLSPAASHSTGATG